MKKKVLLLALVLVMCVSVVIPAFAAQVDRVRDGAGLLEESANMALEARLADIHQTYSVEVMVVTVEDCDGLSWEAYAEQAYMNYLTYDSDGILLLIDMDEENRGLQIFSHNLGSDAVGTDEIEEIGDAIAPYLTAGEYAKAFDIFADECEYYLDIEINGEPFRFFPSLVVSLVIGAVLALIVTGVMKGKLKTVRSQRDADNYVRQGSMKVTVAREFFLYRTVTRREKPKSNSSSGGGGGGGSRSSTGGRSF